jgi:hypothetical protein
MSDRRLKNVAYQHLDVILWSSLIWNCHQKKIGGDQCMDLLVRVHNELWLKYRKHVFNIKNQFNHYRTTKETLTSTECFIHIDFAENYVGKMSREIQSKHFGASQIQITLHGRFWSNGLVSICFYLHSPQLLYMQFILCVEQTTCCTRILVF